MTWFILTLWIHLVSNKSPEYVSCVPVAKDFPNVLCLANEICSLSLLVVCFQGGGGIIEHSAILKIMSFITSLLGY